MERLTYTSLLGNRVSRGGCKDVKCGTDCDACGIYKIICKLWEYEETGLTPDQVAAMKQELIDERYRHDRLQDFEVAEAQELARVKAELDATKKDILKCCKTCAKSMMNNGTGLVCRFARECSEEYEHWEWRGAKDTNVPSKEEENHA